jgi:hypothetical protein
MRTLNDVCEVESGMVSHIILCLVLKKIIQIDFSWCWYLRNLILVRICAVHTFSKGSSGLSFAIFLENSLLHKKW